MTSMGLKKIRTQKTHRNSIMRQDQSQTWSHWGRASNSLSFLLAMENPIAVKKQETLSSAMISTISWIITSRNNAVVGQRNQRAKIKHKILAKPLQGIFNSLRKEKARRATQKIASAPITTRAARRQSLRLVAMAMMIQISMILKVKKLFWASVLTMRNLSWKIRSKGTRLSELRKSMKDRCLRVLSVSINLVALIMTIYQSFRWIVSSHAAQRKTSRLVGRHQARTKLIFGPKNRPNHSYKPLWTPKLILTLHKHYQILETSCALIANLPIKPLLI